MLHNSQKDFIKRHIGPSEKDQNKMLKELGYNSLDHLIESTVPEKILFKDKLSIGESNSEYEALRKLKACLLYTSPSPRDYAASRMPSSA